MNIFKTILKQKQKHFIIMTHLKCDTNKHLAVQII